MMNSTAIYWILHPWNQRVRLFLPLDFSQLEMISCMVPVPIWDGMAPPLHCHGIILTNEEQFIGLSASSSINVMLLHISMGF